MTETDYKKAKRNICILAWAMTLLLLLCFSVFLRFAIKKDNPALSAEELVSRIETAQKLYVKLDDTQYMLPVTGLPLASEFDDLSETKERPQDHVPYITIHFGELYEFYIYADGIIEGFDGYAGSGTKSSAFYQSDSDIYTQLSTHILADGKVYDGNLGFFK